MNRSNVDFFVKLTPNKLFKQSIDVLASFADTKLLSDPLHF